MTSKGNTLSKHILRASAVLVVAMGASACSTVPDWVDPTTWVGDDSTPTASAPADQGQQTADNGQTPDLSTIPDRPQTPSTSDEQRDVAQSLASDRSKAQYSADALRGGTEPSAAPPPVEAGPATEDVASNDNAAPAPEPVKPAGPPPVPAAGPGTLPADNAASSDNAAAQPATAPAAAPSQAVAATDVPPPAAPAVPAVAPAPAIESGPGMPAVSSNVPQYPTTDAALGFRPSSAPPLDATVAQFVPPSILARYRQTAAISAGPAVPVDGGYAATDTGSKKHKARHTAMGQGGPEKMSGAVTANFDSLQSVEPARAGFPGGPQAVVFFPHDTTVLDVQAKAQVRAAAQAFLAQGGQGYVRVIGHSSNNANSMQAERSMVWNFERSQARANAVARLLIREGVPAAKVLVQAAGGEEAQSQSDDGNRRAEIFFQS